MTNGVAESVAQQPDSAKRPFGMRDKIGYMFGDFGNDFTFILQMMFFMLFYTNVVGISPAHIGLLFLIARLVDGFTDIGMGIIIAQYPESGSSVWPGSNVQLTMSLGKEKLMMPKLLELSRSAAVIFGPAARPLPQLPITVDDEGYLVAQSDFTEPVGPSFWERH